MPRITLDLFFLILSYPIYPQVLYFLPPTCIPNSFKVLHSYQVHPSLSHHHFLLITIRTGPFLPLQTHLKVPSRSSVIHTTSAHWFPSCSSNEPSSWPSQECVFLSSAWNTNSYSNYPDPRPLRFLPSLKYPTLSHHLAFNIIRHLKHSIITFPYLPFY